MKGGNCHGYTKNNESIEIKDMIVQLEQYYESVGFSDYYNKVLKDMSKEQIKEQYNKIFEEEK